MNILDALKRLRDDIKTWVANNLKDLNNRLTKSINNIPKFSGNYNDLTDAPNIIEDESGNMIITDESGNIIFKADADGIHTTAVSLNGEAAATEKYVDDAIANADVDLTGYATEDFVTSAVESAKEDLSESVESESDGWKIVDEAGNIIFSVDAEGAHTTELTLNGDAAATEKYVDDAIANIEIPEVDFTGYATETYVDNKVADLVNSAPEALNTLGELATALENHEDAYDALLETVGGKATHTDLENLKEELSESITSEADEWKVVDGEGNMVLSVDATGLHTTDLTLNGESIDSIIDGKLEGIETGGATPDWDQNDESAPDYIKNRTHYKLTNIINLDSYGDYSEIPGYDVESNFGDYRRFASVLPYDASFTSVYSDYLGELAVSEFDKSSEVNGKYIIYDYNGFMDGGTSPVAVIFVYVPGDYTINHTIFTLDGPWYTTTSLHAPTIGVYMSSDIYAVRDISSIEENYIKLDEKYIPDTIARTAEVKNVTEEIKKVEDSLKAYIDETILGGEW